MKITGNIKIFLIIPAVLIFSMLSTITAFAEPVLDDPAPVTDNAETEPLATEPPATEPPATEPPATESPATEPPATEQPAETQPATETVPVTQAPATKPAEEDPVATVPPTYDVNELPTLANSTEVAEDLPTAIGADNESGGVSMIGGIVCWIAVGISSIIIIAFLLSTKGRSKSGIGRYESGNKIGGHNYKTNIKY